MGYDHPRLRTWMELGELLYEAAEAAGPHLRRIFRERRRRAYRRRQTGPDTPFWNVLAAWLRPELRAYGDKARLARYLGVPRQRVTEYLSGRTRRLPDAELTLRLLHWLAAKRGGQDHSA